MYKYFEGATLLPLFFELFEPQKSFIEKSATLISCVTPEISVNLHVIKRITNHQSTNTRNYAEDTDGGFAGTIPQNKIRDR